MVKTLSPTLKHEPGSIVAEGDFVIVHGRFSGFGQPVNWIAADILRIEDGISAEHWDVIQDEATQEEFKSKAPIFGTSLPHAICDGRQRKLTPARFLHDVSKREYMESLLLATALNPIGGR